MFPFKLMTKLPEFLGMSKKTNKKYFEPNKNYEPPSPGEIRKCIEKSSRCPKCHFIVFDNYWASDIDKVNLKICSTCGTIV